MRRAGRRLVRASFENDDGYFGWLMDFVGLIDRPVSGRSFHPNVSGHRAYAGVLASYIRGMLLEPESGVTLAGLPTNPAPDPSRSSSAGPTGRGTRSAPSGDSRSQDTAPKDSKDTETPGGSTGQVSLAGGLLVLERTAGSNVGCSAGAALSGARLEFTGTDGDDVICVPDPDDPTAFHVIDAKAGNDTILAGNGIDWIHAGAGDDTVYARGGGDIIHTEAGNDTVYGGRGFDTVHAVDLIGTVIDDPGGYELIIGTAGSLPAAPQTHDDRAHADAAATVAVFVLGNDSDPDEDLDPSTLRITRHPTMGTAHVVSIDGNAALQYTAPAVDATDVIAYEVCDRLGACSTAEVTVTVGSSGCTIVGTDGADTLHGTSGDDVICGAAGADTIYGNGGDDIIIGGAGDDTLWGQGHNDRLHGGPGDDTIRGGAGDDMAHGDSGNDSLDGGNGTDYLNGGTGTDACTRGHTAAGCEPPRGRGVG